MNKLSTFRAQLRKMGLDGFIVPHADQFQGEYLPANAERLAWLTEFTGSAGAAVILPDQAVLFADGRYTIQAKSQSGKNYAIQHLIEQPPSLWLSKNAKSGQKIGYDPWLHTPYEVDRYRKIAERGKWGLVPVAVNPIDVVWRDRPDAPDAPVTIQPLKYAGVESADKCAAIAAIIRQGECQAAILTQPDSIAWLLNIRGTDVPFNPLALCFAILHADQHVDLYIDPKKIGSDVRKHFGNRITIGGEDDFLSDLSQFQNKRVWLDHSTAAARIADTLRANGAALFDNADPCVLLKAVKNKTEQNGMRAAHKRDGVAMAKFLFWLSKQNVAKHDEISIADQLQSIRAEQSLYQDDSFPTISGFGPNGAIVHYRAMPKTKSKLAKNNLLLLDSGAQYRDGTTDITRTVALGKPTAEQRDRFTRVLKGHIALAMAKFPRGTSGSQLDSLARQYLWQADLDYDHGTGHGVGCYLSVHEGPQRISKVPNRVALEPGMVISNEPGYYKTGAYGIRIENLIMVQPVKGSKKFLEFETLTLAPIDRSLIDVKMLSIPERDWLNAYHSRVYRDLNKRLSKAEAAWLKKATAKI